MLDFLRIQGLALIDNLEMEFSSGMNVLTGETGAGKSFILKALNFLLGEKMHADMVRHGHEKAHVEAIFLLHGEELILRRELLAESGRSRFYINGNLSSQDAAKELRPQLIVHTSQHAQHKLLQASYQAQLIDASIAEPQLLQERSTLLQKLQTLSEKRKALQARHTTLAEKRDLLEMQQQEIDKVAPEVGEEDKLEQMRAEARRTSTQAADFAEALTLIYGDDGPGLRDLLGQFEHALERIGRYDDSMQAELEAISALRQGLPTLEAHLRKAPEASTIDMDALESRLYALAQLKRKLRRSLEEILELREEIDENISFLDSCSLDISLLEKEEQALTHKLQACLETLQPMRRHSADIFAKKLEHALAGLGFSKDVHVIVDFTPVTLWENITDEKARILWAPNPGQTPQPLDKIASGGELSRFLLALVSIKDGEESATYIFDEVDAGIGGLTLNMVAERLQSLAQKRQMLLITHWPQLAAQGSRHFQIKKQEIEGSTFTQCTKLDEKERQAELIRMAGGEQNLQGNLLIQHMKK